MKKNRQKLLCGLTSICCALLAVVIIATQTALSYATTINSALGISVTELVSLDDDDDAVYYSSDYGDVNNLTQEDLDALLADEDAFVETEMEEGAVLLSNENNALPLSDNERKVTLFGSTSANPYYKNNSAGGNNDPTRQVSFYDALIEEGFEVNETLYQAYLDGSTERSSGGSISEESISEEPISFYTDEIRETYSEYSNAAIVVLGRYGGESSDILTEDEEGISGLALHQNETDMLQMIHDSGEFNKVIVIVNSAYPLELESLEEYGVDACMWIGTTGLVGFRGVVDLLIGDANPSGHLVDTYATDSLSAPATQNFGDYTYANSAEVVDGCNDDEDNLVHYVVYSEGIYVGYKYYETRYEDVILGQGGADSTAGTFASSGGWNYAEEVLYPFGYGLSYTTFEQTLDSVTQEDGIYTITATVTNTGDTAGKDVVQVYVQTPYTDYDRKNLVEKSAIQLAGFEKTSLLDPGESETLTITVDSYLFASYDYVNAKGYILDAGDYYLSIGDDAHDALNNVLAAKGATGMTDEDGNPVDGDADKTYHWTQEFLDTETFRYADTGTEVTNQFADVDLNYWIEDATTYLTRQDWEGTFPAAVENISATDQMITELDGYLYETAEDAPSASEYEQGVDNGLSLVDMFGLEYDDPLWEDFLDQLTLDDMVSTVDEVWGNEAVESVIKPENRNQDGPGGVAGPYFPEDASLEASSSAFSGVEGSGTAYVGQAVAASGWNKETIAQRGYFLAEDALFCGVTQLWCPGGNIHRTPFSGRNFEYYSEDSVLSYIMSGIEVESMQSKGLSAAIKHFVMNDQETNRQGVSTFSNEQAVREIYLKAFEGAFVVGGATSTMTSYNRIGCTYVGHSEALLRTVLRDEWGFTGATISDAAFGSYMHAVDGLVGGTDFWCLAMMTSRGEELKTYIETNDDGYLLGLLRESQHGFYYMLANSNLVNGLTENMEYVTNTPWWQIVLYSVIGVLGIATIVCVGASVFTIRKEKKQNQK